QDHHEGWKMKEFVEDPMGDPERTMEQWKPQRTDELPDAFCGNGIEPELLDVTAKFTTNQCF
nr:anthranilate synthase alpha subunit 2, chloroplastic-like [Tanacetum cinerariifolium]